MARPRTVLCPYCFEPWSTRVAAFRCISSEDGRILKRQGRLGQAFAVKKGRPVRCECGAAARPVCPSCHTDLPQRFAEAPSRSLGLIGTRQSGKTNFIAVVLHELEHRVGPRFDGSLMLLDDSSRDRVDRDLMPRLYGEGMVLSATQSARAATDTRQPLVARLSVGRDRASHSNLVFFDSAGEDLQSLDVLEREARYITQSNGLILLIDPLQIPAVQDELAGEVELPADVIDVYTMLGRVSALIREATGVPPNRPIEVPLALTVSKFDALRPLLSEAHPVFALPSHDGSFDAQAARSISAAVRADLAGWLGERLDSFVKREFATTSYFGVSALGESPVAGRLPNGVAPHRVEDPVLWMLDTWDALPSR
jgi:Double-GTPase 2